MYMLNMNQRYNRPIGHGRESPIVGMGLYPFSPECLFVCLFVCLFIRPTFPVLFHYKQLYRSLIMLVLY